MKLARYTLTGLFIHRIEASSMIDSFMPLNRMDLGEGQVKFVHQIA